MASKSKNEYPDISLTSENKLQLYEIIFNQFIDKHHHFWSIYFRFLFAIVFVAGVFVWYQDKILSFLNGAPVLTIIIGVTVVVLIAVTAIAILIKESANIQRLKVIHNSLATELGIQFYKKSDNDLSWFEKISIRNIMIFSIIILALFVIAVILLSFYLYRTQTPLS